MEVVTIGTPQLGDRSYLVHDGNVALVVDPQRDIDRVQAAARDAGVRITHVVETHLHNDYVTGGVALARESSASYLMNGADDVAVDREPVSDGDEIRVGSLTVRVVATPGHTRNHVCYVVSSGDEQAVFSGGSLLYGSVGRTDLVDPAATDELTRAQYHSARRLVAEVSDRAVLYPTHGFGSFCSSGPATVVDSATIGDQKRDNHALTDDDEDHFVETLVAGLAAYPGYYAHMGELNRKGAEAPDLSPPEPLDADELRSRLRDGQWVVDLRNRVVFADDHLKGTVSFEYGDGTSFTTYLGWILPWGSPVTVVGSRDEVEAAVRDLSRIGIDQPWVAVGDRPEQLVEDHPTQSYPRVGWSELLAEQRTGREPVVLDVRGDDEYATDHLDAALHVPLHSLLERMDEIPHTRLWVHCGSGYRAGVAASILQRAGHDVVHIDADWPDAADVGLSVVSDLSG